MILYKNEEGYGIKLTEQEWDDLWDGKKINRAVGYSEGYFRVTLESKLIPNPYDTSVLVTK